MKISHGLFPALLCMSLTPSFSATVTTDSKTYKNLQTIQAEASPATVLLKLKAGNERYVSRQSKPQDYRSQSRYAAIQGQFPVAYILSCMDSRSIPEVIFNQSAGSLFVNRVAGNVIDKNMLASIEYAASVGTRLFVIMGHTRCGAIEASCIGKGFGNIDYLISEIKPAVDTVMKDKANRCSDEHVITDIAKANVMGMIEKTRQESPWLAEKIASGQIELVGAMHDIETGKVTFFK